MATENNRLSARDRYQRDPIFHALVRQLTMLLENCEMTPTEVREAVILAATIVEERRLPRFVIERGEK